MSLNQGGTVPEAKETTTQGYSASRLWMVVCPVSVCRLHLHGCKNLTKLDQGNRLETSECCCLVRLMAEIHIGDEDVGCELEHAIRV